MFIIPEVVEKLSRYKNKLFEYNEISGKRNTILTMISLAANTSIILGIITLSFTGFNQLFVNSEYNMTLLKTTHVSVLTTIILGIGLCRIAKREFLEKLALKEKGEYIRPVVLLQAEQEKIDDKRIHVSQIKEYLINELKIPDNQIAIRTGTKNEIKGVDLFSKKCTIRYIITVSALKEGWDFSFAYVLISVANIESRISVEQTLGRVLRLTNQKLKVHHELNYSYVYISSRTFEASAKALEKGLLQHGYSKKDFKKLPSDDKITEITYARKFKDELKIPCIAVNTSKDTTRLKFHINLLGSDFELSKQKPPDDYPFHFDENRRQKIDVGKGDKLKRFEQKTLSSSYSFADFDKPRLLNWLDKKILLKEYTPKEKRAYFEKVIYKALEKMPLQELSLNCHKLKELIIQHVNNIELVKADNTF